MKSFANYEMIFNNIYYTLEGLESEYSSINVVKIPIRMKLLRSFIKIVGIVEYNQQ
jgi:hypothetical protein